MSSFKLKWTPEAVTQFRALEQAAKASDTQTGTKKPSRQAGLLKQVQKTLALLQNNPKHPGLNVHPYDGFKHPYDDSKKVWEAYVQNQTPGAYRLFWCYGPGRGFITVIAITPHP